MTILAPPGMTPVDWLAAAGATVVTLAGLYVLAAFLQHRLQPLARATATGVDDAVVSALAATHGWFMVALALFAGSRFVALAPGAEQVVVRLTAAIVVLQFGAWTHAVVVHLLAARLAVQRVSDPTSVTTTSVLAFAARLLIWSIVLLLVLDNLGFDITALVASLGIGGVAVALALQNILGDLFSSLAIALDKPVVIDDFIVLGDFMGTVERVGLKTTRLRSLSGEQIILSNADLLGSRIRNYKRMSERRIQFSFGVTYQTTVEQLEAIPAYVREIVCADPLARLDRAHLRSFGDSALEFEVVYYVASPEYNVYMDAQQRINLGILRRFAAAGIDMAYPTRTVHLYTAVDAQ